MPSVKQHDYDHYGADSFVINNTCYGENVWQFEKAIADKLKASNAFMYSYTD